MHALLVFAAEAEEHTHALLVFAAEAEEHARVLGLVDVVLKVEPRHLEEGERRHEAVAPRLVRRPHPLHLHRPAASVDARSSQTYTSDGYRLARLRVGRGAPPLAIHAFIAI